MKQAMGAATVTPTPVDFDERGEEPPPRLDAWSEPEWLAKRKTRIRIPPEYCEGLRCVKPGRHYRVLCYAHYAGSCGLLVNPHRDPSRPPTSVFAARSPRRPNPIALSLVPLVAKHGCNLEVIGLDAYDSTPVLGIKPYARSRDEPGWWA